VVEPTCPGAVERYVNLGKCYDSGALWEKKGEIKACMAEYPGLYQRAYRCLRGAGELTAEMGRLVTTGLLEEKLVKRAMGIARREFKKTGRGPGKTTKRFLTAITHKGVVSHVGTLGAKRVYQLVDSYHLGHTMLETLRQYAAAAGYDVVACADPMNPEKWEGLWVPELSLAFVTGSAAKPHRRLRLDGMVDKAVLAAAKPRLRFSKRIAEALAEEAVEALSQAKALHDKVEAIYNPHVDFNLVRKTAEEVAREILTFGD